MAQVQNGQVVKDQFIPVRMSDLKAHGSLLTHTMANGAVIIVIPPSLSRTTANENPMLGTGGWLWHNGIGIQANVMHKEQKPKKVEVAPQASAIFG